MKVAVLGATGMLGHQVYLKLRAEGNQTFAVIRKSSAAVQPHGLFSHSDLIPEIDFLKDDILFPVLAALKPDVVINCSGVTTRKLNRWNSAQVIELNSVLPHKLSTWCEQNGSRLFHISTDCVFDGKAAPYSEDSVLTAKDLYGMSKALGEIKDSQSTVTIRCSIWGPELVTKTELFEWVRSQAGKTIHGYSQVIYSGVTTLFLAETLARLIVDFPKLSGLYQVASTPLSKFELLQLIQDKFQLQIQVVEKSDVKSNKTLLSDRFQKATGITVPTWKEQIQTILNNDISTKQNLRRA